MDLGLGHHDRGARDLVGDLGLLELLDDLAGVLLLHVGEEGRPLGGLRPEHQHDDGHHARGGDRSEDDPLDLRQAGPDAGDVLL
ncbi:hypothetical protein D3C87_1969820 [compost metagenome]